jgi:selenocysteine lyase/cysteine desulfurase
MTLVEILNDEARRRHEFPVCGERVFLAHAGVCPLPRRVSEALATYAHQASMDDQERPVLATLIHETRLMAARLINAQADEIALVGPTSLALSLVAGGLPLRKGDNILIYFDDYPSNVYPWTALAERGVEVRLIQPERLGEIRPADVLALVDENTRLAALASCHFISGWRLDLPEISRELRARGVALCIDGIQTVGAFSTLAEHADFIAADAHKWMLGPCGAGLLYVSRRWHETLRPIVYGWNNVRCPEFVAREEITFRSGAHRYEAGTYNITGLVGLRAALELTLALGLDAIARELIRKRTWLASALEKRGWQVLGDGSPPANQSGILSCTRSDVEMAAVHKRLSAARIDTSLRTDRAGRRYLRFSPHFYNTDAELERALELL